MPVHLRFVAFCYTHVRVANAFERKRKGTPLFVPSVFSFRALPGQLVVHRFWFFINDDCRWNTLDFVLVFCGVLEMSLAGSAASPAAHACAPPGHFQTLRLALPDAPSCA